MGNFLKYLAWYVVARFTFRAVDRHGFAMLQMIGAIVALFAVVAWLYS